MGYPTGCSCRNRDYAVPGSVPNPMNFKILEHVAVNGHVMVGVKYPGCTNFEGDKILVFRNTSLETVLQRQYLDPHFSKTDISPFARFQPTSEGWDAGLKLMAIL